jgi:hypothetical protein
LQQVALEQWLPHFLQLTQQVPHLLPEQQFSAACAMVAAPTENAATNANTLNALRINIPPFLENGALLRDRWSATGGRRRPMAGTEEK